MIGILSNNCIAADVTFVKQGDKVPYDGYLFTVPKEQQNRYELMEKDALIKTNSSLQNSLKIVTENQDLSEKKVKLCIDQANNLSQNLNSERSMTNIERLAWFGLGAIAVGLAAYGLRKASQ